MSMTIYHNPRCSKSRQTLQLLEDAGQDVTIIEYLRTPPDAKTLKSVLQQLGISARDLLRTGEDEYKMLGLDDTSLSEDAIIHFMLEHPKLIERPIVVAGNKAVIGRPPEKVLQLLEQS